MNTPNTAHSMSNTAALWAIIGGAMSMADITTKKGQADILQRYNDCTIDSLPPEALKALFAGAKVADFMADISQAAKVASVNYEEAKGRFLRQHGAKSMSTATAYRKAFEWFERFCKEHGIEPLALKHRDADDFIAWLQTARQGKPLSAETVRLFSGAMSSFFTWIQRDSEGAIKTNPFTGSKAKPKKQLASRCAYPSNSEAEVIIAHLNAINEGELATMVSLMASEGFRAGAFRTMEISPDGMVNFVSKGKEYTRRLSEAGRQAVAGLSGTPFAKWSTALIGVRLWRALKPLAQDGAIEALYSAHDFRHLFAMNTYERTGHDIKATQEALGHTNIAITDNYLRGLERARVRMSAQHEQSTAEGAK